jgi:cysteinyl-tRNA synthetase
MQGSIIDNDPQSLHNSEIEVMISKRSAAKNNNNFTEADEIRAQLLANGVVLEDTRNGTTWRKE